MLLGRFLTQAQTCRPEEQALLRTKLERSCRGMSHRLFRRSKWPVIFLQSAVFACFSIDALGAAADLSLTETAVLPIVLVSLFGVVPLTVAMTFRVFAPSMPSDQRISHMSSQRASLLSEIHDRLQDSLFSADTLAGGAVGPPRLSDVVIDVEGLTPRGSGRERG